MVGQEACLRRIAGIAAAYVAIALWLMTGMPIVAQGEDTRFFEETGHTVSGEFLQFFDQHGGLSIFGYPLTTVFEENGYEVQYFQRVRMELHPDNPDPYKVQLGLLGDELKEREPPIPEEQIPPAGHAAKRYFPETGHTVSFAFLAFYDANGSLDVFGYPIAEWKIEENGRIVQYFQRAKMEWYPENPVGQRVQLAMLGAMCVEGLVDPIHTKRENPGFPPDLPGVDPTAESPVSSQPEVTEMRITATLSQPIIGVNQTQTAYIYVFDQDNRALPGASVNLQVRHKDSQGDEHTRTTNDNGYCRIDFDPGDPAPGYVVIVNVVARCQDAQAEINTAFLPWW